MSGSLAIARTASLLVALGGFAEEKREHSGGKGEIFTPTDIELIRSAYEQDAGPDGRLMWGRGTELARRLGRDPIGIHAALNRLRASGMLPPLGPRHRSSIKRSPRVAETDREVLHIREARDAREMARRVAAPLLARPAWFDASADRMDKARLMAGR